MKQIKIIFEKHPDACIAYPIGLKGVIIGEGNTYEEVIANLQTFKHYNLKSQYKSWLTVKTSVHLNKFNPAQKNRYEY